MRKKLVKEGEGNVEVWKGKVGDLMKLGVEGESRGM